jgi:uncharacterized protein YdbL (DUF1318 family)
MMRQNESVIGLIVLILLLLGPMPLFALSLDEAKEKGLVGEKANGYLGVVAIGDADAQALSDNINQKRRQIYQDIAQRNKTNVHEVETLAGEKAVHNTKPGNFVESHGSWVKK